jgi:two-component system chemotaxis response regulator CheB
MEHFPVVCLGASVGGLAAYQRLLAPLPAGACLALVAVNHVLDPGENPLPRALRLLTAFRVVEIESGMRIKPGYLYVSPAGRDLALTPDGEAFELRPVAKPSGWPRVLSAFLDSLAREWPGCAVAVILSGLDGDGAAALCRLRAAGGLAFAQAPETALSPDLPQDAIASGCVDRVLSPEGIARELLRLAANAKGNRLP